MNPNEIPLTDPQLAGIEEYEGTHFCENDECENAAPGPNHFCATCRAAIELNLVEQGGITVDVMPGEYVAIHDKHGEIVYWDSAEWLEDADVCTAIANALVIGYTEGAKALRAIVGYPIEEA